MTLALLGLGSLVLGLLAPGLVRPWLRRGGLVDVPNHRSSHTKTTLRGGGLGVLLAVMLSGVVAGMVYPAHAPHLLSALGTVAAFGLLGYAEDFKGLPVKVRLCGQAALSLVGGLLLLTVLDVSNLWLLVLVPAGVFLVNAANFMDGTNGISGFHGVLTAGMAIYVALDRDQLSLALLGISLAGAFAGYLPWNFPSASMFLGDVGSYLLGGSMWVVAAWVWFTTGNILLSLAPVLVYTADVIFTLIRRVIRRVDLTEAHREHVYQRIHQNRGSHVVATLVPVAVSGTFTLIGIVSRMGYLSFLAAGVVVAVILVVYCSLGTVMVSSETRNVG